MHHPLAAFLAMGAVVALASPLATRMVSLGGLPESQRDAERAEVAAAEGAS